ncbi:MAG: nitroreductase, partial [Lachnospiraceae bacterium]|nr:nitroreductase [Lachnospiraceae bacterium]
MDALDAIFTRRSTRKMRPEMPPKELVEKVIEAGRAAPSGGNNQTTHFIVITKKEVFADLAAIAEKAFAAMEVRPDTYRSLANAINASKRGGYIFHYHAPVLIVVANRKGYGNAMADSSCALENMMIAANALDLGSCWINQLHWLDEDPELRAYMKDLGLSEDETITGGLILGYGTETEDGREGMPVRRPLPRTGNPVT